MSINIYNKLSYFTRLFNYLLAKVNFVNYKAFMNDKNKIKNVENKAKNSFIDDSNSETKNGIYLRDDHCDWGSSGMNEFTNEFSENN